MAELSQHLALIGYRGSGKTSLGMLLSERLRCPWIDLDAHIEESCNRRIADIFEKNGEAAFRDFESASLEQICHRQEPLVLSTGGGCVLRQSNRELLAKHCQPVVYLQASAEVLSKRLALDQGDRPSLSGEPVAEEVATVLAEREGTYRAAASHIVDANSDLEMLVQHLLKIVEN